MPAAPAWVSTAVAGSFDLLQDRVPPAWMPKLDDVRATRGALVGKIPRLGCISRMPYAERKATPPAFRDVLLSLARGARR